MTNYKQTVDFIKWEIKDFKPLIGIILGSGLGNVVDDIDVKYSLSYSDIHGFIPPTIDGHKGNLIFGYLSDIPIVAMQGRNHFYEGHTMKEITYPIRIMGMLGIKILITSNAVGSLNDEFEVGDIMLVRDHINLMGTNPLIGPNDSSLGPRFLDMSSAYDKQLIRIANRFCINNNIRSHEGVLTALSGPTYETPSEYKMLRILGGDVVGMSTIPEVLVARHMGIKVFSMSLVTNTGVPGQIKETSHEEVQLVADKSSSTMSKLIKGSINDFLDSL